MDDVAKLLEVVAGWMEEMREETKSRGGSSEAIVRSSEKWVAGTSVV